MMRRQEQDSVTIPRLLSVRETSKALGISTSKVYELIASRQLAAYRPGGRIKVPVQAIRAYLNETQIN